MEITKDVRQTLPEAKGFFFNEWPYLRYKKSTQDTKCFVNRRQDIAKTSIDAGTVWICIKLSPSGKKKKIDVRRKDIRHLRTIHAF